MLSGAGRIAARVVVLQVAIINAAVSRTLNWPWQARARQRR